VMHGNNAYMSSYFELVHIDVFKIGSKINLVRLSGHDSIGSIRIKPKPTN